jgi:hypothetical protein
VTTVISTTTQPTLTTPVARSRAVTPATEWVVACGPRIEQGSGLSPFGMPAFGPCIAGEHGSSVSAFGSRTRGYVAPMQAQLDTQKLPVAGNGISKVVVDGSSGYRTWSPPV